MDAGALISCFFFAGLVGLFWFGGDEHEDEPPEEEPPHEPPTDNEHPEALDDFATICADETTTLDVLANDSDPDDDDLAVTSINGVEVAEGETVEIGSGAVVTLVGGEVVYDPNGSYDDVLVCDEDQDGFTYGISDGEGGEDFAEASIQILGSKPTVELLDELSIPETADVEISGNEALYDYAVTVSGTGTPLDGVYENAYCLDEEAPLEDFNSGDDIATAVHVFGSDDISYVAYEPGTPSPELAEDLDNIGWLLNENFQDQGYSEAEIQAAVWKLTNADTDLGVVMQEAIDNGDEGTLAGAEEIYQSALIDGEGYVPQPGDTVAIVLKPTDTEKGNFQPFVVGVKLELLCECKPNEQVYA
jgi:hypothetical protein